MCCLPQHPVYQYLGHQKSPPVRILGPETRSALRMRRREIWVGRQSIGKEENHGTRNMNPYAHGVYAEEISIRHSEQDSWNLYEP